jgi:hypothetical protein
MLKKLLLLSFALIFIASFANAGPRLTKAQLDRSYGIELVSKHINEDGICGVKGKNTYLSNWHPVVDNSKFDNMIVTWDTASILRRITTKDNIMDYQSNANCFEIIQDPNNPNKIHLITMYAPPGDGTSAPNRRTKYWYSNDKGQTFTYVGNVSEDRTGYAQICLNLSGVETITTHVSSSPAFYLDAAAGLGSWTKLSPTGEQLRTYVWGRTAYTNSVTNPNKFVSLYAPNNTTPNDSAFWFTCTSISPAPGTFSPWNLYYGHDGEEYAIAKGTDGRIGIVYTPNTDLLPGEEGDLYIMESTDNGTSFATPTKIFDANITPSGDSLGILRGFGFCYQGNNPCVVFETPKLTETGWFPTRDCKMRFWSKTLPGSDPNRSIVIVDSNNTPYISFFIASSNANYDIYCTYTRPSIGASTTGSNALFVSFLSPAGYNNVDGPLVGGIDTVPYMATYIMYSANGGSNWDAPKRITAIDTTTVGGQYTKLMDYSFPNVSPYNDFDANFWYMNMAVIEDSIPGSYQYHTAQGEALSKHVFMRIKIPRTDGINNISNITPAKYSLNQNYPNPFNPVTSIRFSIPKVSVVTLKVYDITGKLVSTLVNNETVSIGEKEVRFDASNLSSGVYFYSIKAGDFSDTRKMVVVK